MNQKYTIEEVEKEAKILDRLAGMHFITSPMAEQSKTGLEAQRRAGNSHGAPPGKITKRFTHKAERQEGKRDAKKDVERC